MTKKVRVLLVGDAPRTAFIAHIAKIFDVPLKFLNVEPMPPLYSDFGLCPVHGIVRWCSCWDENPTKVGHASLVEQSLRILEPEPPPVVPLAPEVIFDLARENKRLRNEVIRRMKVSRG